MKRFLSGCILIGLSLNTAAAITSAEPITPAPYQSRALIDIVERLSSGHYEPKKVDDEFSRNLLDNYLDDLDPSKTYFTKNDIEKYLSIDTHFDDMLKRGDLAAGFAIYNLYLQRVTERMQKNIAFLESDFEFNYALDEVLSLDDEIRTWADNEAALDELWRKVMKDSLIRLELSGKEHAEAQELLIKRYKGLISQLDQRDAEDAFARFVNSFTALYGPHTTYMSPRSVENFQIAMSLSLEGIGAVLQLEDEYTKIVRVVPKGPADKTNALHSGDKITAVAQDQEPLVNVVGWRLDDVVKLIRGKKGTTVRLEVIPAKGDNSVAKIISIVRDKIQFEEQAAQSNVITIEDSNKQTRKFGVIEIPTFYTDLEDCQRNFPNCVSTSNDTKKLLSELIEKNVDGIILDLRNNGGGYLHEATMLTDLFIDAGPIVQIRTTGQRVSRQQRSKNPAFYDGPLFVLINRLSASASEIFAGAIQDYGRGVVIGSQSFGKGTVQSTTLVHEGLIKLTESKFYRVSGDSTQNRGVIPDITLPSLYDLKEVGESSQPQAMKWDQISPAPHRQYTKIHPEISSVQEKSNERHKTDPDLSHLIAELNLYASQRNEKQLTLNFQQRLSKKAAMEEHLLKLENSRRLEKGLLAYDNYETWSNAIEEKRDLEGEIEEENKVLVPDEDPLLFETGRIFSDYLDLVSPPSRLVDRSEL